MKLPRSVLLAAGALAGILAMYFESRIVPYARAERYDTMIEAARLVPEAQKAVARARLAAGIPLDPKNDPNGTGLIGVEFSDTTTSLGELDAKRTGTSPDMAALMVKLLSEAGVKDGDLIAVGASGSFPGATIATLAAARAMNLDVALIASLGASTWGANLPAFSYLAIHDAAFPALGYPLLGVSLGGGGDDGGDMSEEGALALRAELLARRAPFIGSRDTADAVSRRMKLYDAARGDRRYAAFVNIGGASANIGDGMESLSLRPGLNPDLSAGSGAGGPANPNAHDGVLFAMAARGVPVIHILNLRGLAAEHALAWDPVPFPPPGEGRVYRSYNRKAYATRLTALSAAYLSVLALLWYLDRRNPA